MHAADICQSLLVYYTFGNLQKLLDFNDLDLISLFISRAIHNLGRPGFINNFLINSKDDKAVRYNDQNVLENFHVSEGFNIILIKNAVISLNQCQMMIINFVEKV